MVSLDILDYQRYRLRHQPGVGGTPLSDLLRERTRFLQYEYAKSCPLGGNWWRTDPAGGAEYPVRLVAWIQSAGENR